MAQRPIFVPCSFGYQLVREVSVAFGWNPGLAPSQKKKNVSALHEAARSLGISPLLEVSTKSDDRLGFRLSAFILNVATTDGLTMPLESAFQGSKVFASGGPYKDLYGKSGFEIKKDERLKNSGALQGFVFDGIEWDLEPKTAFYDWLYVHAVHREPNLREDLCKYKGFTDIEFNPERSVNCQARSCALYVSLLHRGVLDVVIRDRQAFLDVLSRDSFYQPHSADRMQGLLFKMEDGSQAKTLRGRRKTLKRPKNAK